MDNLVREVRRHLPSGELVPLSTVATISKTTQPNALTNFQQLSSATLQGVPFPGHTLGEATRPITRGE